MEEVAAHSLYEYSPTLFWVVLVAIGLMIGMIWLLRYLGKKIDCLQSDVTTLKEHLVAKDEELFRKFSMKKSPRILNSNGEAIYEIIKGQEFLQEHRNLLLQKIEEKHPSTMLDVEIDAREVCIELQSNPIFNGIKNIVYDHPEITIKDENDHDVKHSITMPDVCFVLSIPLRNMYLDAHKEIEQQAEKSDMQKQAE